MEMTIFFSRYFPKDTKHLEGNMTYFLPKIWSGLMCNSLCSIDDLYYYMNQHEKVFNDKISPIATMKLHTMRDDKKDRWQAGKIIHFKCWTGKPYRSNQFQFAPLVPCTRTEKASIKWYRDEDHWVVRVNLEDLNIACLILWDNSDFNPILTCHPCFHDIYKNDGFENYMDFFAWFNKDWEGKIIHWTDLKYYDPNMNTFKNDEIKLY